MQMEFPSTAECEAAMRHARELRSKAIGEMLGRVGRRIRTAAVCLYSLRKVSVQLRFAKPQIR